MKPIYVIKSILVGSALALSAGAQAQLVGGEVFLQGKYVELGITDRGSYGTTTSPTTYHSHPNLGVSSPGGPLGFVADPDMDGWAVGTPPFMGDYFYPGSPFEGWELQIDTVRHQEFNMSTSTFGSNISYSATGSKKSGTWQGMVDSVVVTQVTTIDTNDLYFTIQVTLTNLATTAKNNIYYFRTLDPDNDESWTGGAFTTNNKIEHQSTDTTVVSATGTSSTHPYLALGTADTAANCLVYSNWPVSSSVDIATMYNQTYTDAGTIYAAGATNSADYAIGLIKYIPHLATVDSAADSVYRVTSSFYTRHPANSATFTFYYAFSPAAADSANARLHKISAITLGVKDANAKAAVRVYPNPSKDIVNVEGLEATDHVALYDMVGRQFNQNWKVAHEGTNIFQYGNVPVGNYLLVVTDANGNVKARMQVRKM